MANMDKPVNIAKLFQSAVETDKPEVALIQGKLPPWLKGTYFRVGPNKFDFEKFTMNHLFDGYAMIQKFEIGDNQVIFEKKYLLTDSYRRAVAAQKPVVTEFATTACSDPNKSLISKVMSALAPEFTDNNYSTLFRLGPDLFAICDTCFFRQVDMKRMGESPEKHDSNKFFGLNTLSAHPLTDENGDVWNVGFTLFSGLRYQIVRIPKGDSSKEMLKKGKVIASIPSRWNGSLSTIHSFGLSKNHVVVIEQPLVASITKLCASLVKRDSVRDWLDWRGEDRNRFIVVSKSGKICKTEFYSKDSFYFLHVINCHEEESQLVLDVIGYASPAVLDAFYLENLRKNILKPSDFPEVHRFVIPLIDDIKSIPEGTNLVKSTAEIKHTATSERKGNRIICTPENLCPDKGLELPSINLKFLGQRNKYFYGAGTVNENWFRNKLCKINTLTKEIQTFKESDHVFPGEPVFVPNPDGDTEDDGVLVAAMSNCAENHKDFLVFLDQNMKEIARVTFKNEIPSAVHGIFVP